MRTLMVANDGGHIMQLHTLRERLDLPGELLWLTNPTPQTESLLAGEQVYWLAPSPPRDMRAVVENAARCRGLFDRGDIALVVSTGAAMALSVIPLARAHGVEAVYIESATRTLRPSLTGRLLTGLPGVKRYHQSLGFSARGWKFLASPWDLFEVAHGVAPETIRSAVVSVGTQGGYGFPRLIERLTEILPPEADVLWQTGSTDIEGLGIVGRQRIPAAELHAAMGSADVVVAHAGTGVALAACQAGKSPVLVPRRAARGEHVDDHQLFTSLELSLRGLAVARDADHLDLDDLRAAAGRSVRKVGEVPRLRLG